MSTTTNKVHAQCFHPGEYIKDEIEARGWDVLELARRMSIRPVPIEFVMSLLECRKDITPNTAFGLARAFGTSVELWLNLQKAYSAWKESRHATLRARN